MKRRPLTTQADKPSSPAAEVARPDVRDADAVLTIDLAAIIANYHFLRQAAHPATCAAVVKADAYGLGVGEVAPALQDAGCAWFFVATLDEGIALRDILGPASRIGILNGLAAGCERVCWRANLTPVINTAAQYRAYAELAGQVEARLPVILQFDTGMTRLGLSEAEALALAAAPSQRLAPVLVMSHLACAPTRDHPANAVQLAAFQRIGALFPGVDRSLAASSGIFLGAGYHFEMVRPGAALFGISPCPGQAMRPVVRVQGRVMQMREVPEGTAVGYGHEWRAARPTTLATIAVGYADGVPRSASHHVAAWYDGRRMQAVGCLSMDSMILDATNIGLRGGQFVDLIGPDQDVDTVAAAAGTIGYEILTRLGHRFERRYLAPGQPT